MRDTDRETRERQPRDEETGEGIMAAMIWAIVLFGIALVWWWLS